MSDPAVHAAEEARAAAEAARAAADLATTSVRELPELVASAVHRAMVEFFGEESPPAVAIEGVEEGYDHVAEPLTEATS